jgi:hypothetical protein
MNMNWYLVVSGLLAAFCTVGHLAMGGKMFLKPMMEASFDEVPKKVMHCVFHFITVDFVLATIALLAAGFGLTFGHDVGLLVLFIAVHFLLYGLVQIVMVLSSGIRGGLSKIFQWAVFLLVAIFAFLGAM